ncbi:hypothetical protein REIP_1477 [Rickettsia endosymbiont of Ixodes pacificus]|nr:hypothetical protein REIP_1477 [Rickettsia endosymbiont of Ixodes pacificus]
MLQSSGIVFLNNFKHCSYIDCINFTATSVNLKSKPWAEISIVSSLKKLRIPSRLQLLSLILPNTIAFRKAEPVIFRCLLINPVVMDKLLAVSPKNSWHSFAKFTIFPIG